MVVEMVPPSGYLDGVASIDEKGAEKVAVVALTVSGQTVLIVERETDQTASGDNVAWVTIPTGEVRDGEFITDAAKRILLERTGFSSAYFKPYFRQSLDDGFCWVFLAEEAQRISLELVGEPPRTEGQEDLAKIVRLNPNQVLELLSKDYIETMIDQELTRLRLEIDTAFVALSAVFKYLGTKDLE